MVHKGYRAEAMLEAALKALRDDLVPALPAERRYEAAMVTSALDMARRDLVGDIESAEWALLDRVYDEGEGMLDQLARDIRAGKVSPKTHADLVDKLRALVVAELKVRNPRFLLRGQPPGVVRGQTPGPGS